MAAGTEPGSHTPDTTGLLERDEELEVVATLHARAREGRGGLVLFEGAPGVGKTSVLDEAASLAEGAGFHLARARGHELEQSLAWGLVRTLLEGPVLNGPGAELLAGPAAPATVVFAPTGEEDGATASERWFAIAHGLYRIVVRLTERGPLLLVVDDAQWADEPSLRFVPYASAGPVLDLELRLTTGGPTAGRPGALAAGSPRGWPAAS